MLTRIAAGEIVVVQPTAHQYIGEQIDADVSLRRSQEPLSVLTVADLLVVEAYFCR